ncbi:MAG: cbb3-type cytochrome c oxidase subunit I [Armatimonadetes bacterium]|jgi:cytochrome c oxidase subunit 1|nr:cbb3-type cytochrome c oxidase subunit I [Armatimonadota bacterium]
MSVSTLDSHDTSVASHGHARAAHGESPYGVDNENYINTDFSIKSWLLTVDHKRIALLYLFSVSMFFLLGGLAAGLVRLELTAPKGQILSSDAYNRVFSAHGIIMVFLFLIPAVPAILANFALPLMIGARDLAFPRLNLLSWYVYMAGGTCILISLFSGGVDTGWTFYTPYSSIYANGNVALCLMGVFLGGFSSIFTGLNFIVTVHKMRAPGMTWFRLPLFVWALYATSVIIMLGTPVVAVTLLVVLVERTLGFGVFSPELGGDPVLFQHMFWFYSHPAVYIMMLPALGIINEIIATNCKKRIFGYEFVAMSSLAIAAFGFVVWGHHMFATAQSMYSSMVFSIISFLVAVPSAVKVFNWIATIFKGSVELSSHMIFALGFIGLFVIGGLTGMYLAAIAVDVHLTATYFVVAHFHYVMVGGALLGFMAGLHYWWPKMTGRLYPEFPAKLSAIIQFVGFNMTFFPQFIVGYLGMPRRYHFYAPEYQIWHIASSAGSTVLGIGFMLPVFYLMWSWFKGEKAVANPWGAVGLEWTIPSPPVTHNFLEIPVVTWEAYEYHGEHPAHDVLDHAHDHDKDPQHSSPVREETHV